MALEPLFNDLHKWKKGLFAINEISHLPKFTQLTDCKK